MQFCYRVRYPSTDAPPTVRWFDTQEAAIAFAENYHTGPVRSVETIAAFDDDLRTEHWSVPIRRF